MLASRAQLVLVDYLFPMQEMIPFSGAQVLPRTLVPRSLAHRSKSSTQLALRCCAVNALLVNKNKAHIGGAKDLLSGRKALLVAFGALLADGRAHLVDGCVIVVEDGHGALLCRLARVVVSLERCP